MIASTAAALLEALTARFAAAGIATARADARWIVRHALDWSAADLVLAGDRPLSDEHLRAVEVLADRRARREPLQLVLGGTSFRGHALTLRPGVFVPRPETELLVDLALEMLPSAGEGERQRAGGRGSQGEGERQRAGGRGSGGVVVEPCTGSGAIACAIAAERPDARVVVTDADAAAVDLAASNAADLGVRVDVRHGWLLDPVPASLRGHVDVLVANPPYLAADEVADLEPEVGEWDPRGALVAGATGHEISDLLWAAACQWLRPAGGIVVELDERRVDEAARRAAAAGLTAVATHRDLTGRQRFVSAHRPPTRGA